MIQRACLLVFVVGIAQGCASPGSIVSPISAGNTEYAAYAEDAATERKKRKSPRVDISLFGGSRDLDEVEFDPDEAVSFGPRQDLEIERDRSGVRFAFGRERLRGHFQLFSEELEGQFFGPVFGDFDAIGIGGGFDGLARLNDDDDQVGFLIPYTAQLSFAIGVEDDVLINAVTTDAGLAYFEAHADIGFGIEWMGLRPSVGVQLSSLSGAMAFDNDLGADGDDDEIDLSGTNLGPFAQVYYRHPGFPLYVRFRAGGGDYDVTELSFGAAW